YGWKSEEIALARALEAAQKAVVLDSDDAWAHLALGFVYVVTGYRMLVVNCALIGEIDEARAALAILKRLQPDVSVRWIAASDLFPRERERQEFSEGFRLAGLE